MPEMLLIRQPRFTYSACRPFPKNKERIQKVEETKNSKYIYQKGMAYTGFKDLHRKTASDKVSHDQAFSTAKTLNMMDINVDLLQCFINFLIKSSGGAATGAWSEILARQDESVIKNEMKLCQTSN